MYRVDRNDFYSIQKNSTVYTPPGVSRFLYNILHDNIASDGVVLDPCVGAGSLLYPFAQAGFETMGIDIEDQGYPNTVVQDFISIPPGEIEMPSLVIANPPFNITEESKQRIVRFFGQRPLLPEVWLHKTVQLWGRDVPLALFAPYGLRLNQSVTSKRWRKFAIGEYPEICSIVALPKDVYDGVLFHSEVLIFNVPNLKGHYFYNMDEVLKDSITQTHSPQKQAVALPQV